MFKELVLDFCSIFWCYNNKADRQSACKIFHSVSCAAYTVKGLEKRKDITK